MDGLGLRYTQLVWCNLAGLRCTRCVVSTDDDVDPPSLCTACITLTVCADVPAPGSGVDGMGGVRLVPDPTTMRVAPWAPGPEGQTRLALVTMHDEFNEPWRLCPRALLQRVLAHAREKHGLTVRTGFEIEFVLADGKGEPLGSQTYCSSSALDASLPVLQEMCAAIHTLGRGMRVEQLHKESAPGQFEIVLGHLPALEAADAMLLAKQAIVAVAHRRGLRASFLAKLAPDQAGSGNHVHLSLWSAADGQSRSTCGLALGEAEARRGLKALVEQHGAGLITDPAFQQFLAGIHAHLPSLMCFTTPTPNSFRRLQPSSWAGCFWCWGFENKEAPIRIPLVAPHKGLFTNVELKLVDGTANTHVALAAVIAAGIVGIEQGLQVPPPTQCDPASLPGSAPRLPQDFAEAKAHLMGPERAALRALLGEDMVQCYLAVRQAEWERLGPLSLEEEARLLFDRY